MAYSTQGKTPRKRTRKSAPATATPSTAETQVSPEQRYKMIQEAAYFKAEKDGFRHDPKVYWLAAEREIDERLGRKT